jgi:hypothetical protein
MKSCRQFLNTVLAYKEGSYGSAQPVFKNKKSEYQKHNLSTKLKTSECAWFGPGKMAKQKVDGVS